MLLQGISALLQTQTNINYHYTPRQKNTQPCTISFDILKYVVILVLGSQTYSE